MKHSKWVEIVCIFVLLLGMGTAKADTTPRLVKTGSGCYEYAMCDAQTATGVCTVLPAGGDELVANMAFMGEFTFDGTQSVGAYTCDIYHSAVGYDAVIAIGGDGQKLNSTSLSATSETISFSGLLKQFWVSCPSIATSVTIVMWACPGR